MSLTTTIHLKANQVLTNWNQALETAFFAVSLFCLPAVRRKTLKTTTKKNSTCFLPSSSWTEIKNLPAMDANQQIKTSRHRKDVKGPSRGFPKLLTNRSAGGVWTVNRIRTNVYTETIPFSYLFLVLHYTEVFFLVKNKQTKNPNFILCGFQDFAVARETNSAGCV